MQDGSRLKFTQPEYCTPVEKKRIFDFQSTINKMSNFAAVFQLHTNTFYIYNTKIKNTKFSLHFISNIIIYFILILTEYF